MLVSLLTRILRRPAPVEALVDAPSASLPPTSAVVEHAPAGRTHRDPGSQSHGPADVDGREPARRRRSRSRSRRRSEGEANGSEARAATLDAPAQFEGPLPAKFAALGVDERGLQAVAALGFDTPTPIQVETIPILNAGRDVVGLAETGTGKTIAFGLPLARSIDPAVQATQALVLVPTRELASQVYETLFHLGRFYGFTTIPLVGGKRIATDLDRLARHPHVVVGTPGRVIDHINRGTLDTRTVTFLVLDEADQMFDIGFARDIDYIIRRVPKERQTALFSATMPPPIARLVGRYMRNAAEVSVSAGQKPASGVQQYFCEVAERDKILALRFLYEEMDLGRSLIFRRTRIGVDRLTSQLQDAGVAARAIHGDLRQSERDRVMADFRSGRLEFLVATNVAARGLDIPDIAHVINYDVPQNAEEYIHRVGRTARAGKTGKSVTFVSEWELTDWDRIVDSLEGAAPEPLALPARWD